MKSKITIDLDESGKPVITIAYCASDDLKDKVVGMFIDNFRYENGVAKVEFKGLGEIRDTSGDRSFPTVSKVDFWQITPSKAADTEFPLPALRDITKMPEKPNADVHLDEMIKDLRENQSRATGA